MEGTSTRDVAALAGVNQAPVYRHFGSKEKLFAEAADQGWDSADTMTADLPLKDLPRALRAELLAALITGVAVLRGEVGAKALTAADREAIGEYVDRMAAPHSTSPEPLSRRPRSSQHRRVARDKLRRRYCQQFHRRLGCRHAHRLPRALHHRTPRTGRVA
ncbi:helix-turn-helix domain-containing protein [Amycolatopsis sp. NPDC049252]|uniref:helix-turn-helix domain-containing protein n=1 Tax=Amycolatopsis sp. NPDC049252 TaxID=3363933 RepID=UPI00371B325E